MAQWDDTELAGHTSEARAAPPPAAGDQAAAIARIEALLGEFEGLAACANGTSVALAEAIASLTGALIVVTEAVAADVQCTAARARLAREAYEVVRACRGHQ